MATAEKEIKTKKTHVVEVVRHGEAIVVPSSISLLDAAGVLTKKAEMEEQIISIKEVVPVFPWEGAIALRKAMDKVFGATYTPDIWTFFGKIPPAEITIDSGVDEKIQVPWGRFAFPGCTEGEWLSTGSDTTDDGRLVFAIQGEIKRKWQPTIAKVGKLCQELAIKESIYRGKALKIDFEPALPVPKFLDLSKVDKDEIVFNADLAEVLDANVSGHIVNRDKLKKLGVPFKMGVLLAGEYGTGKSLYARAVALDTITSGATFIYLKDSEQLAQALQFAAMYQPAVVFGEDIDRAMEERDDDANEIINLLDGIDTKHADIMVLLTTNHLDKITKVLLRPGRIDLAVKIELPNALAVERLFWTYGRNQIEEGANLIESATIMAGKSPATIREVVERSKRFMVARGSTAKISADDLKIAALTVLQQIKLIDGEPKIEGDRTWPAEMVKEIARTVHDHTKASEIGDQLDDIQHVTDKLPSRLGL